ncbi:hypothetical protein BDW02DRAFT_616470 [Decorospora gaudefroyi]|uniref:Uncharacterized protein n=1 Tax=Decorospora gaudefroyi TaxID=184978 RepID=A0A6A5KJH6_9PLEO|nr:hypothetical protein BDW02DRAFT_616470 [Decorospora gaudefroyi]
MSSLFQNLPRGLPMPSAFLSPKGSNPQKKKILLEAWPGMSPHHRADVAAWRQNSKAKEDLMKTKTLLLLLHHRGRHQPHEFVHSDLEQAALGETSRVTMPGFLNEYTMLFVGRTSPKTYGELVSWDDDDDAFENMTNGVGMDPGHGLQALEIQQRIWEFMVKCCQILLQDVASMAESAVVISLEAPYRIPARLDFTRLKAMASAERNSAEDHLWALCEDPSYFAEIIQDLSHPALKEVGRPLFWSRVLGNVVVEAYSGFATFDHILKQINRDSSLHEALRCSLDAAKTDLILKLKNGLFASPPFRQFCVRHPEDPGSYKIRSAYSPPRQDHAVKRLMPLFNIVFSEDQFFLFGLHTVTDEIKHLVRADAAVAALISPMIANRLSSLSVVSECLHQLHVFQPWARKIEDDMELKKDELRSQYTECFKGWLPILRVKFEGSLVYQYADPTDGKFDYPLHRRRNKQNVDIMRRPEENLDAFWEAVDKHYRSRTASSQHDLVAQLLRNDRAIQRTPAWEEHTKSKKPVDATSAEYVYQPFSRVYHDKAKQITGNFSRATPSTTRLPSQKHARAHKVFKALFHSPSNPNLPGVVPWPGFLHAMVTMGFSAEKLHGSAWNFTPKTIDLGVERSIQFHEPHPSNRIPFLWARRFGRRLAKAYGWEGEMFRLA